MAPHPQGPPKPRGTTIVKFVMKDDPEQTLDVVKEELTAHGLKTLRKYGYVQASKLLQEQAKVAAEKELPPEEDEEEDEEEQEEEQEEEETQPPIPEPPKTPGRPRRP